MVQPKKLTTAVETSNGNAKHTNMSFQRKDLADGLVGGSKDTKRQNGSTFRTDSAISGSTIQGERKLQRWVPDADIETDMSLESSNSGGAAWDQFAVNAQLFGLKTDYDETIYTTAIDKSHPDYRRKYAEADRKAREIEGSATTNRHIAEERITDNLTADDSGFDEEDKYSGVQRTDFPPLKTSGGPDKYTPPARRPAPARSAGATASVSASALAPANDVLADPAIISSKRPDKVLNDAAKSTQAPKTSKSEISTTPTTTESSFTATPEPKATPANSSATVSRTQSPQVKAPEKIHNATATVEQDVLSSFKGFAQQQRVQADKLRSSKLKADKEVKLHELKKFAANFKLHSPLPNDLVTIIARDPEKRKQIQEAARRNAEEAAADKLKHAKATSAEVTSLNSAELENKTSQRPAATQVPPGGVAPNRGASRVTQGPYNNQFNRPTQQGQPPLNQQGRPGSTLSARLKSGMEQNRNGHPGIDGRQPPTGPSSSLDPSISRRSSGTVSMLGPKLNPNSHEFRPNAFAPAFSPNGNRSTASSPRSSSVQGAAVTVSLLRRKPGPHPPKKIVLLEKDIIQANVAVPKPPMKNWDRNGDFKPAFETPLMWRVEKENEPEGSTMKLTHIQVLEKAMFRNPALSPRPLQGHPQVPHQHQLPFHLQQGAHNMQHRQSPRQPQMHMHGPQHSHGPNVSFNGADDHRMMSSHSAQSYASPRLQQVNMAPYPAPMGQSPQLTFNQPGGIPYVMAPGAPQMQQFRSYSGGPPHMPQQGHMPPVMMAPPGSFIPGQGIVPGPQMLYQQHYVPQGNGPPMPMVGTNGYPSPGRGAPMMVSQGSQQGQPVYGMSSGMPNVQPIYGPPQPGQMPNMRGGYQGQQPYGTSPQMHQYSQPNRGPSGNFNKNFQHQQNNQHQNNQSSHSPSGPQARPSNGSEDAK